MTTAITDQANARARYVKDLVARYQERFPASQAAFERGRAYFPNGICQPARMLEPFPPFIEAAQGAKLRTVEGVELLDYWQGHFCSILGHNPPLVLDALRAGADDGLLLQIGVPTVLEEEVAALLLATTDLDQVIFSTSGALATMHSILLALAYTRRSKVLKVNGGWHGAHPWGMKGVRFPHGVEIVSVEGAGISKSLGADVVTIPFNDCEALHDCFANHGSTIGACILELVLGNSGMVMATTEFVQEMRELSARYGALLIVDELVTGFRVRNGGFYEMFDLHPDIITFGKAISGGMPFACMVGRREIFAEASTKRFPRVWADSGTFTAHPASLLAARAMLQILVSAGDEIFPRVINRMDRLRERITAAFRQRDIPVHITGNRSADHLPNFPIGTLQFPRDPERYDTRRAIAHWDATAVDIDLRERITKIALLLNGVHCWQGLGVMTDAHTEANVENTACAYERYADEVQAFHERRSANA